MKDKYQDGFQDARSGDYLYIKNQWDACILEVLLIRRDNYIWQDILPDVHSFSKYGQFKIYKTFEHLWMFM